eukprot:14525740-Alexandrium_andersonii.AAC.1
MAPRRVYVAEPSAMRETAARKTGRAASLDRGPPARRQQRARKASQRRIALWVVTAGRARRSCH